MGALCVFGPASMPHNEDMHYRASFDSVAPPRLSKSILQVGAALVGGACLGLLAVSLPKLQSTNSVEFTSLVGGPTSLRHSPMTNIGQRAALASLPGGSWKDVALAAMQASEGCRRDISVRANPQVQAAIAKMDSKSRAQLSRLDAVVEAKAKQLVQATTRKTVARKSVSKKKAS